MHTYATLEVSSAAHVEIAERLRAVGYEHAIIDKVPGNPPLIDMHGIALTPAPAGQGEWIACSERMPQPGIRVDVVRNGPTGTEATEATYSPDPPSTGQGVWDNDGWPLSVAVCSGEVSWWKPKPAIPGIPKNGEPGTQTPDTGDEKARAPV